MTNDLKIQYERLKFLSPVARTLCYNHGGWIVGSTAEYLLGLRDKAQRDLDILVPFYEWGNACMIVPAGTPANSFGGFKLIDSGVEIDLWAGDIGWFITQVPNKPVYAIQIKSYTILVGTSNYEKSRILQQPVQKMVSKPSCDSCDPTFGPTCDSSCDPTFGPTK